MSGRSTISPTPTRPIRTCRWPAARLKPWFRFPCKRPLSNNEYYPSFNRQAEHIAYIIHACPKRGVEAAEPTQDAQDGYVRHFREIEVDTSALIRECTPSYYSNEGDAKPKWLLLRGYGHGWNAFMKLLSDWRDAGDLAGLDLKTMVQSPS